MHVSYFIKEHLGMGATDEVSNTQKNFWWK